MKKSLLILSLCSLLSVGHANVVAEPVIESGSDVCDRCAMIINDIRTNLAKRCEVVPTQEQLRKESVYIFLSIYDQVSQGINPRMRDQVYNAALQGMQCDNLAEGVEAAKRVASRLQHDAAT